MKVTSIWDLSPWDSIHNNIQVILKDKERQQNNWIIYTIFLTVIAYLSINKNKKNTIRASQLSVPIIPNINNWQHNNNFFYKLLLIKIVTADETTEWEVINFQTNLAKWSLDLGQVPIIPLVSHSTSIALSTY